MPFYTSSEESGESAHLHRLTLAFVTVKISRAALNGDLCAIHASSEYICTDKVTGQCNKYQDLLCWQQRLFGVCTFAQACLSLLHTIEILCAG